MENNDINSLKRNITSYLDIFFKNYKYSIDVKLKRHYINIDDGKIDPIMLYPCEKILINKNEDNLTQEDKENLERNCIIKNFWTDENIKKFILGNNKCNEKKCSREKIIHKLIKETRTIISYQKTNGNKNIFYEISFIENTQFSEEMRFFYKYFISKTLDMFQLTDNLEIESNIFIESIEEYKLFITKAFLSELINKNLEISNSYQLIENLTQSLKLNYEKSYSNGYIIISKEEPKEEEFLIKFETPISIKEIKKIRKILEISKEKTKKLHLYIGSSGECIGLLKKNSLTSSVEILVKNSQNYIFKINTDKNKSHYFIKNGNVSFDIPELPEMFSKCKKLLNISKTQSKGALIVILPSQHVNEEIKRLSKTGIKINKFLLEEEYVLNITSIDGATIIDKDGNCYGMGVILDSDEISTSNDVKLDPSRGARYNSACKYHESLKNRKFTHYILVVSEDGDTDYFYYIDEITEKIEKIKSEISDFYNKKENKKAIEIFEKNQAFIKTIDTKEKYKRLIENLGEIYNLAGISYSNEENRQRALEVYNLAIDIGWICPTIYNNIAVEYNGLKDLLKATQYYIKALEVNEKKDSLGEVLLDNISIHIKANKEDKEVKKLVGILNKYCNKEDFDVINTKLKAD